MSEPARLLCYGGTGHEERTRIGRWPEIGRGALDDLLGLPARAGRFQFGCAVLGGRPVLLFRERQNEEQRGGYAFTMLLDPGDDTWTRFGWNAALLLLALGVGDGGLHADLRTAPEKLSADGLAGLVGSLVPPPVEPGTDGLGPDAMAAWAGTTVGDEKGPFALATSSTEAVAGPVELARFLAALPVCLRPGQGWLVGGGTRNAEAFGCRLALDPPDGRVEPPPAAAVALGRELLEAITGLPGEDEMTAPFAGLAKVPVPFWAERLTGPASETAERIVLAYRLGRTGPIGAATADRLKAVLRGGGPLATALSNLAVRRLAEGRAAGDADLNALLASAWLDGSLSLFPASAARLEPALLRAALVERGIEPADARVTSLLDLKARTEVWAALAARPRPRERVPELALRAARDVDGAVGTRTERTAALTRILETAFAQSAALRGGTSDWEALCKDRLIGRWVRKRLLAGSGGRSDAGEADPHPLVRAGTGMSLADVEEDAPEAFLQLLTEGDSSLDEGRRETLRRLAVEAAATRNDVVSAFAELLAALAPGDPRKETIARRLAPAPEAVEPLLAAAGKETARKFVTLLSEARPTRLEAAARTLWKYAHESLRSRTAPPNPALTTALLEHLSTPAGSRLGRRIGTDLYGLDASQVEALLAKLLAHLRSRRTPTSPLQTPPRD